ncbi:seven-hairpin glycosidase [Pseudovirgaria hyperparasitica]|uniref:alpha-1,2-Mannosidase n=1 Tax=Pseudovirgaria hyperparasitica TaxID=470096 RepID=A0A6A6WMR0_9PEZI|nr:seven-hairpin glycosidase [Pseudovirgaria hyperparasitica]KAF2763517.1 seven-hairpin glycosidase [Pseudovirgaria hyperparasitica]
MNPLIRRWISLIALSTGIVFFLYSFADNNDFLGPSNLDETSTNPTATHVSWKDIPEKYPLSSYVSLPTGAPIEIPKIQFDFQEETTESKKKRLARQKDVKDTFMKAWRGYKKHAWLQDEVAPVTGSYNNKYGGWAATLVDNLDTLLIMGMEKEFVHGVVALKNIDYTTSKQNTINVFETTIRHLGGLLSAHDLSNGKHPILLKKAVELGEMLYAAFDTPNRLPMSRFHWQTSAFNPEAIHEASMNVVTAELGSLSLEFTRLSQLTGDLRYYDAIQRITDVLEKNQNSTKLPGMWPLSVNSQREIFTVDRTFTLGAMADSLYEYFPKQHMLLSGLTPQYQSMYETAIEVAKAQLFFRPMTPSNADILISGSTHANAVNSVDLTPEGQHLTCFVGGMVGIAAKLFSRPEDIRIARQLTDGCVWAYKSMPTGIMPEIFHAVPCSKADEACEWDQDAWYKEILSLAPSSERPSKDFRVNAQKVISEKKLPPGFSSVKDARYMLRPEAIESVFILYRITGDQKYADEAWEMFSAVKEHTATDIGAAGIQDVRDENSQQLNECESFWMAETLKYFYLIFSEPNLVSLDDWVLNTEAHPLKRPARA